VRAKEAMRIAVFEREQPIQLCPVYS